MTMWKAIPNYEGLYEVGDNGQVRSLHNRYKNKEFLKQSVGSRGYLLVTLCKNGVQKTINVHRIVANAFVPNPNNLPCVNHKDENKENNSASNLEWCSYYYNNTYGERLTKSALKRGKPVICIENQHVYPNAHVAHKETGIQQSSISNCCNGKAITAGGFHWFFLDHTYTGISRELSHES